MQATAILASEAVMAFFRSIKRLDPAAVSLEVQDCSAAVRDTLRELDGRPEMEAEMDRRIIADGAHAVAALLDHSEPLGLASLPSEFTGPVTDLLAQLVAIGAMEPYAREDGGFGIW